MRPICGRCSRCSAVADLVTRAAGRRNSAASGYATLGAGGRASAVNPLAGQAFEPSEPYGLTSAGAVFHQRTGLTVDSGLVHLGIDELDRENEAGVYDPTLGAFGDALARGTSRAQSSPTPTDRSRLSTIPSTSTSARP